jgi:signal transduction histidine kinase
VATDDTRSAMVVVLLYSLLLGALVRVRLWANGPVVTCLVLPLGVALVRLGPAAGLAALPVALAAAWMRRLRGRDLLDVLARESIALVAAVAVVLIGPRGGAGDVLPAVGYAFAWGLVGLLRPPRAAALASAAVLVALAPLVWLPLAVGAQIGDAALFLLLTALLVFLLIAAEAGNLAVARLELQAERDRLAAQNALLDDVMSLLAHDIRSPLTLIQGAVYMGRRALGTDAPPAQLRHLEYVEAGIRALDDLAGRFVQLRKLEEGQVECEPVLLPPMVETVLAAHRPLAEQRHITLLADIPSDLPPALASEPLLREALANLLSNALKYTPEGGRVSVWARAEAGDTVVLGVTDTGIGLTPEDLQRLFTRFFRSADTRVRSTRGHGLGLALTNAMVLRMHGRIDVTSKPDHGSTFSVVLRKAA